MVAVALALTASVAFGVGDFVAGERSRTVPTLVVVALAQWSGTAVTAAVLLARGEGPPSASFVPLAALAGALGAVGITALYRALAVGTMSVVAPIAATSSAVPVVAGVVTGERPSAVQNAGIVLAVVGVVLASRPPAGDERRGRIAAGVGLALVAALTLGCFLLALDEASEYDPLWAVFAQRVTSALLVTAAVLVLRPSFRLRRVDRVALPAVGTLDVTGNMLFAVATTKGLVGVVSVLASLFPLTTVALARVFLAERLSRGQALGVGAALGGVALIAAG
ncbi:MAG: EamA family transporter [Actinomycetota bacterium]|nr:EamA family transporter [Actinomycetota bacterium]